MFGHLSLQQGLSLVLASSEKDPYSRGTGTVFGFFFWGTPIRCRREESTLNLG